MTDLDWIKEIQKLEKLLNIATKALKENANEDFRGNRSSSSVRSFRALEEIRKINETQD